MRTETGKGEYLERWRGRESVEGVTWTWRGERARCSKMFSQRVTPLFRADCVAGHPSGNALG